LLHPFGDLDKSVETGSESSFAPIYALSTAGNRLNRSLLLFCEYRSFHTVNFFCSDCKIVRLDQS
jgi:hypothetical protein